MKDLFKTILFGALICLIFFSVSYAQEGCPPDFPINCGDGSCCPADFPVCCTGLRTKRSCCPEDYPYCGNLKKKCYAEQPTSPCAASMLLGENSDGSNLLRDLRDEILFSSDSGEEIVTLYYEYSDELISIMLNDVLLRNKTASVLSSLMPAIKSVLEDKNLIITQKMHNDINSVCDSIANEAGPDLRQVVKKLRDEFNRGVIAGDIEIIMGE
jgi:hypothetical protein